MKLKLLSLLSVLLVASSVEAQLVFDFTSGNLDGGEPGSTLTVSSLTLTVTSVNPDGKLNWTSSGGFGINSSIASDDTDGFDTGESFSFSFDQDVTLTSITVSSWNSNDNATLTVSGSGDFATVSSTGLTTFALNVTSGSTVTITANGTTAIGNGFYLDSLSVSAIPEPSTYAAILGALALGVIYIRRRKQKAVA